MYADDSHLSYASDNVLDVEQNLNQNLESINQWLIANHSKTEFTLIGSKQIIRTFQSSPSLEIGGMPINQVSHTKSVSVWLDENLIWNQHIDKLSTRLHLALVR